MAKLQMASFLLVVAIGCVMLQTSTALIHVVGGSHGWEIPPNNTFYNEWVASRTFGLGNKLVFPYRPGGQNVYQVTKEDFESCGHDHVINQWALGPTVVNLNTTGDYYFYSSVGTHCEMGQKLHIVVADKLGPDGINWATVVQARQGGVTHRKMLSGLGSKPAIPTTSA